ncbi:MAG TPA: transcription-repair coupling factor [Thermomicrobiales bacterium]|nr:transcription-repair coupling factor [Thermomicrobiales bacterium]
MSLSHLLPSLRELPSVKTVLDRVAGGESVAVADLPAAARPALIASALPSLRTPILVVTARADRAVELHETISEYLPAGTTAALWPTPDALPYEQLPFDLENSTRRVALLDQIRHPGNDVPSIIVAANRGLAHLTMSPDDLDVHTRVLRVGERLDVDSLMSWATSLGYEATPLVQEPGSIARRGGIVDIYPPAADLPIRIDLFGDEIDSIRTFNPSSQRTEQRLRMVRLLPPAELPLWRLPEAARQIAAIDASTLRPEVSTEWARMLDKMANGVTPTSVDLFAPYLLERPSTLLSFLPAETILFLDEPAAVQLAGRQMEEQAAELVEGFQANGELPIGLKRPFAAWREIEQALASHPRIALGQVDPSAGIESISLASITDPPIYAGRMVQVIDDVRERLSGGWQIVIGTDQVDRLTEIFEERGIYPRRDKRRDQREPSPLTPGTLDIRVSDLASGWMIADAKTMALSDLELFGFRKQTRRGSRRTPAENMTFANSLTPGEYVVHIDYGVARFRGLVRIDTSGVEREYLLLEYAKGEKLYVPVDQSDRVARYGAGGIEPTVTKLGTGEWTRVKRNVRRAVREMAFELVQLYATRDTNQGLEFPSDSAWDIELAESFPYSETADQQRAIDDVRGDMESTKPMDRLVCGDVGYGKTEVALRAAFKAVNGGRQVAVLVPTTVLALQHFATFSQRLAPFPVKVEMLSRLRTPKERREVVQGLADGSVDIVIGTHRLVQRDVRFKELGLVIIDEEQRFGVRHKEFLKQLRTEVDVLTMSATPIPRTLHMSLAGIRDISVIDTAPQARLPIRTFVTEFSDKLVREVILREIDRGGQIYVVHNRVHSIDKLAHKLRALVPEARFGIGHGQMDEQVLEEVILSFIRHEYDVLISTTIIESGVDIPNVNTIIIDNADTLGLTQLYQLRGRVGRSTNRAYAYLLYRPGKLMTAEAQERLEAIQEATELGAGLRVAMRDMEIRGAGNILGAEQSGHIAAIGYDLYIRLLSQAVEEIRSGQPVAEQEAITLDLPLTALIPADYVQDMELRLATYRRVAAVATNADLQEIRIELEDRFGPIPDEVEHLLALIDVRIRCAELGIESIIEREREIVIRPVNTHRMETGRLTRTFGNAIKFTPNSIRIRLPDLDLPWQQALNIVLDAVEVSQPAELLAAS